MRNNFILSALISFCCIATYASGEIYTLGVPRAPKIRNVTNASENQWLSNNTAYSPMAVALTDDARSESEVLGAKTVVLSSTEAGFSYERTKSEYYLGDEINPPDDVDWIKTYERFLADKPKGFLFDPVDKRVFITEGGTISMVWVREDGTTLEMSYVASMTCSGRPRRIYWTDSPYNAPGIDLTGKFVKFFGPSELVTPRYGTVTNTVGGVQQIIENKIVSGLNLDTSSHILFAHGELEGQVVIVYYDSGTYERILHVQVVEVCRPVVNVLSGKIGQALKPDGRGHETEGLRARPTFVSPSDDRGEYLYQHKGRYSHSPKNGYVYPLRPTMDCRWNAEVYWMETDEMEVEWPFEVDHYECDWPKNATVFVRGDLNQDRGRAIYIPSVYTPTLMDYQAPDGHARAPGADGTFETVGEGYSLIRLTTDDNIWFLPIRSVMRSNTEFFTLESEEIAVGRELILRGGIYSGAAEGFAPECDVTSPGYIYAANSDPVWNPNLYIAPAAEEPSGISTNIISSTSGDTNRYESAIYAVTANKSETMSENPKVEVWWNTTIQDDDMPSKLTIPTLPRIYSIRWPKKSECPEIVIASQLGSASESIYSKHCALYFEAKDSSALLSEREYFSKDGGTIMFWVRSPKMYEDDSSHSSLFSIAPETKEGVTADSLTVDIFRTEDAHLLRFFYNNGADENQGSVNDAIEIPNDDEWHHIAFVISPDGGYTPYCDGKSFGKRGGNLNLSGLLGAIVKPVLGAHDFNGGMGARVGAEIGEILFWDRLFVDDEIETERLKPHDGTENKLTEYYSFRIEDVLSAGDRTHRNFTSKVLKSTHTAHNCLFVEAGPPQIGNGIIEADTDTTPVVYVQNDSKKTAYNPNEEHAFIRSGAEGHVAWALRSDLNDETSSQSGVLVEYVKGGKKKMQWLEVVLTNSIYSALAGDAIAGKQLPGPHPLDLFDDPWRPETYWDELGSVSPAHRDRKGQLWARAAGELNVHMYYPMQEGFAFPALSMQDWPKVGESIPWLSLLDESPDDNLVLSRKPAAWRWHIAWPENVPEIEIGRTLTVASSGLPEVWNAKSMGVVWPATEEERNKTAVLFDPTVAQSAGFGESVYSTVAAMIKDLGIKEGAGGNATLRKGKWTFNGLPPSISSRFYIDTTASVQECVKLVGELETNPSGVSILHVNVLNESERSALESLFDSTASHGGKIKWRNIIESLATKCVKPSEHKELTESEDVIEYRPRDHYALFTMGATNYVTLIENDSTNQLMNVAEGDPIQMHLLKVVPKYYTGRVVTRQDPLNLLSQQLSVVYAESFAGDPSQYEFEWRTCAPRLDGTVPTDYLGEYSLKFPLTAGLTRFTIGHQGDTLNNMVNTYYAMRYRAANVNSPAYAAMGDKWSEWTDPPALAEGWVQRVLNNVTPFAQRMRDLVENETETAVSMIQQAGAPYEGDVALNQDNLAHIGLLQLYETILSKAESMSLQMGINDHEANKQLQLAVARLADLYTVLGDEAYTDALNPTIAYGTSNNSMLSSAMFAFDNQVPTLLDEELALLRGRSGENAPSTRISPYYNRLVWNITKSPTGGEVAYMVNYNISGDNTGLIDENAAAKMFPQGHGDAYGHYLSALSGYYRLLRNPCFSWGEPAMGEMVVADSVLNVDYYDEAQFSKAAFNVAKVALETVDRTARKSYRDEAGATGAGYLDAEESRAFGYGEWASRGGFGALCNWAVGNSLLPPQPKSGSYLRHLFTGAGEMWSFLSESERPELTADDEWTVEFQFIPSSQKSDNAVVASFEDDKVLIDFSLDKTNVLTIGETKLTTKEIVYDCEDLFFVSDDLQIEDFDEDTPYSYFAVTNGYNIYEYGFFGVNPPTALPEGFNPAENGYPSWEGWECSNVSDNGEVLPYTHTTAIKSIEPIGERQSEVLCVTKEKSKTLIAIRSSNGVQSISVFDVEKGIKIAEKSIPFQIDLTPEIISLGAGYSGEIAEVRVWEGVFRSNDELLAKDDYVSPNSMGLSLYLRPISTEYASSLVDDAHSSVTWHVEGGEWVTERESGMSLGFEDEGLKRIDRSTVKELSSLASIVPQIQRKVDQMDAGLNPLGLATGAIPFDLTPIGVADGTKSHFEQIRERAGTALKNARASLEKAQEYGSRLRLIQDSAAAKEDKLETMELETKNKLIEYFGYPYAGDIGPGGTYPEGYDGPDIYHYAWMEPSLYGLSKVDNEVALIVETKTKPSVVKVFIPFYPSSETESTKILTFKLSASGFVLKPYEISGKRRAQGKIQDAIADFMIAYAAFKNKMEIYNNRLEDFAGAINSTMYVTAISEAFAAVQMGAAFAEFSATPSKIGFLCSINALQMMGTLSEQSQKNILSSLPKIQGAGMTVNIDPSALASAAAIGPSLTLATQRETTLLAAKNALVMQEHAFGYLDLVKKLGDIGLNTALDRMAKHASLRSDWYAYTLAANDVVTAYQTLQAKQAKVESVIAEAERIIDERTLERTQAADSITKERYNDMFFRLARNNALSRYLAQFDLAQKYAYLAAQAYDYETGLLSSDSKSADAFLARIVGARTLGEFDSSGKPIVASDAAKGDGGLAAVLAEMDENWLVLKPRLGINNPQPYATWFSLRHDLFRIYGDEAGDNAWKKELRKYVVEDLNEIAEFRHYCQKLSGSTAQKEPGLVIPFSSLIAHGYNFFGEELIGGDSALDSTYFATHIASAGVHFEGFDDTYLAKTPTAFLVPVGEDRMKAVGDNDTVLSWKVVDQTIPAPYQIGSTELNNPDWTPLYDGATGGNDIGARIRKHPSFRAYYGKVGAAPQDSELDCKRLIGRSAWNTCWLLIIPAGSLGNDREAALSAFINGVDYNRDGKLDFKGVHDIKLGLKTYSTSGN